MRIKPNAGVAVGLAVVYMAIFGGVFYASGVEYDAVTDSAENVRAGLVTPLAAGAIALVAITFFLGWWKPALRERSRVHGWLIAIPIVMVLTLLVGIDYGNLGELDSELLLWIGIGSLLVGFNEELMYRGLAIVGFRGSVSEGYVWLWTSVLFGLLHSINFLLGQGLGATLQQVVVTFAIGSGMYIARRTTGLIVVPMVMHALWDFSSFTQSEGRSISGLLSYVALLAVIIGLIAGRKHLFASTESEQTV
ncbi:MAG: CPBP family intramembrane glutamic endopeptidase [Acidimicrobiia bacterium]